MDKQNGEVLKSKLSKIVRGIGSYLTDWRNLLGHGLLGFVFLGLAIWAPVDIWIKLMVIASLITFNVIRMKRKAAKSGKAIRVNAIDELAGEVELIDIREPDEFKTEV